MIYFIFSQRQRELADALGQPRMHAVIGRQKTSITNFGFDLARMCSFADAVVIASFPNDDAPSVLYEKGCSLPAEDQSKGS